MPPLFTRWPQGGGGGPLVRRWGKGAPEDGCGDPREEEGTAAFPCPQGGGGGLRRLLDVLRLREPSGSKCGGAREEEEPGQALYEARQFEATRFGGDELKEWPAIYYQSCLYNLQKPIRLRKYKTKSRFRN